MLTHNIVTRRNFLSTGALVLSGSPMLGAVRPMGNPVHPTVSASLCAHMSASLGALASSVHTGVATHADMTSAANMVSTMKDYLSEVGYHGSLMQAAVNADSSLYDPNEVSKVVSGYMGKYVPGFALQGLPSNISEHLATIRNQGLDSAFGLVLSNIHDKAKLWPERATYNGEARIIPAQYSNSSCQGVNTAVGLIGAGIFITTLFGCTLGQVFLVICPALVWISVLLGFYRMFSLVMC